MQSVQNAHDKTKRVDRLLFLGAVLILGLALWLACFNRAQPALASVAGKTIVIDPGHGGFDPGALGVTKGVREDVLNLAVAKMLAQELKNAGATIVMTRTDDNALAGEKKEDMWLRREMIERPGVDCVVSIHMNKFSDRSVNGPMVFYMRGSQRGQALAQCVQDTISKAAGKRSRKASVGDYYILRSGTPPCIIVECGFLSNYNDQQQLRNSEYQAKIARAIAEGVINYFNTDSHLHQDNQLS